MGICLHEFNFLRYSKQQRRFGKTITIGRQRLYVPEAIVRDALSLNADYTNDDFCDQILKDGFGASDVDSVDFSEYEGASIIHDLNLPLPDHIPSQYDTVIDGGCLEHIYNVPQALLNCSKLCKPGGQLLHMLPANNCCGHGFWQFSPELFFSLYSPRNGYANTEVFLVDVSEKSRWFRVKPPEPGERINIRSDSEAYVLVRTVLKGRSFSHSAVQQSDYVFEWHARGNEPKQPADSKPRHGIVRALKSAPALHKLAASVYHLYRPADSLYRLSELNPHLEEVPVSSLVRRATDTEVRAPEVA